MWKGTPQVMHSVTWITSNSSRHLNCLVHLTAVERSAFPGRVYVGSCLCLPVNHTLGVFPNLQELKNVKLWSHSWESLVPENQSKHFSTLDKGMETLILNAFILFSYLF